MEDKKEMGVIRPFGKTNLPFFSSVLYEMKPILKQMKGKRITWLGIFNLICAGVLLMWCKSTNSMGKKFYDLIIVGVTKLWPMCQIRPARSVHLACRRTVLQLS
ncbi:zinc transporter 6-like [Centruroides sculpturatus]|uniref:zinc transporter 6-like n=1 Tax=Centruroides sculpturatus TaxID=218467 RepID=UPI000C6EC9C8|nr:zinc transporter 6-like [Centruroides sculpturatus]